MTGKGYRVIGRASASLQWVAGGEAPETLVVLAGAIRVMNGTKGFSSFFY
jgi:hypothetical protein